MSTIMQAIVMFLVLLLFSLLEISSTSQGTSSDKSDIDSQHAKLSRETRKAKLDYLQHMNSRELRIEIVKSEILKKLGMKSRPPQMHDLKANIPKPVFDGEISSLFSDQSDDPAKTTQIIVPAEIGDRIGCENKKGCFSFHLTDKIFKDHNIEHASLQFFTNPKFASIHAPKVRLETNKLGARLISRKRIPFAVGWIEFDVKQQVEKWLSGSEHLTEALSFRISCEDCKVSTKFRVNTKPRYRPFLLIETSERKHMNIRKRRSYSVDCIPGYNKCCRQSLYVSFKKIGWHDWIIEPAGFDVNFCEGRCSGDTVMVAKSHGFVKKELMSRQKKNNALSVCCVPTKFGMLTLLHFDEDGFIFKTTLKNMVVKECGCL